MDETTGQRHDRQDGSIPLPGEYGKGSDGHWQCCPPGYPNLIGGLRNHTVTEHEDGSITVSPSILIRGYNGDQVREQWHGFLECGIWRRVE